MPYYRIVIWTKKRRRPFAGIRWIATDSINVVQAMMEKKAITVYHSNYIDCEVQMLSKNTNAVKKFMKKHPQ